MGVSVRADESSAFVVQRSRGPAGRSGAEKGEVFARRGVKTVPSLPYLRLKAKSRLSIFSQKHSFSAKAINQKSQLMPPRNPP